ncbi:MAG: TIGR03790 family protein [Desulfosoma sp.]|uniref:TIGR03790 family protein n=1 Tax=Desulfosoma sp. TaxID=2603217 RepID=UPI004049E0E9
MNLWKFWALLLAVCVGAPLICPPSYGALTPEQTLVLVNGAQKNSVELARYYMARRKIPAANLLRLDVGKEQRISREIYRQRILGPVVAAVMAPRDAPIRGLVLMDGMPLHVEGNPPAPEELQRRKALQEEEADVRNRLKAMKQDPTFPAYKTLDNKLADIRKSLQSMRQPLQSAALDAELALALVPSYPLEGWVPNPAYVGAQAQDRCVPAEKILVVARLQGPSPEVVKKRIDEALRAEREGLKGIAYFDARWPRVQDEQKSARSAEALYDLSLHKAADIVQKSGRLAVVLNAEEGVFQPGCCPFAALYCGWYSVGRYVDAFEWNPGAVAYHIESSSVWMRNLLARGAAATLGPIREPYLQAFPLPHIFFALLVQEGMSLGEAYILSVPYLSWQMILVGDPLYRPFAVNPTKERSF